MPLCACAKLVKPCRLGNLQPNAEHPDGRFFLAETQKSKSWRNRFEHCVNSEITGKIGCGLDIKLKAKRLIKILKLFAH